MIRTEKSEIEWCKHYDICETCRKAIRMAKFAGAKVKQVRNKCCLIGSILYQAFVNDIERKNP